MGHHDCHEAGLKGVAMHVHLLHDVRLLQVALYPLRSNVLACKHQRLLEGFVLGTSSITERTWKPCHLLSHGQLHAAEQKDNTLAKNPWPRDSVPCASLKRAFFLSMMLTAPIGEISPMSPVWNQPSLSSTSSVFAWSCSTWTHAHAQTSQMMILKGEFLSRLISFEHMTFKGWPCVQV